MAKTLAILSVLSLEIRSAHPRAIDVAGQPALSWIGKILLLDDGTFVARLSAAWRRMVGFTR
ncbi:hypothetical protein HYPDE_28203 [Hyphomicrobium denitrificans 1NES1]|uniref:Uncharacterized protein n=1 Tax=Hyphomicrobium denitrificans 1NES1 TaxID=670307 RepID=N0BB22_9HYPH|nr:hypothetical protein HYPDE_28203 [Hyphomicrobium denitrificans 1NES1]